MNNREIKFRVWDGEEMIYPKLPFQICTGNELLILNPHIEDSNYQIKQGEHTFMQFTGLLDKNGKEIYKWDIIKVTTEFYGTFKCKVEFFQGVFGYMNICCVCIENKKDWDKEHDMVNSGWFLGGFSPLNGDGYAKHKSMDQIEIIGNIHQHPELLK